MNYVNKLIKITFLTFFLLLSLKAKEFKTVEFTGEGIDFLVGTFSSGKLYEAIGKKYPPFYTPWRSDPLFYDNEIKEYKKLLKAYFQSFGYYKVSINDEIKSDKIILNIKKNSPIRVSSINVKPYVDMKKFVEFKEGDIFTTDGFKSSKSAIERNLMENAHPKYSFDAKAYVDLEDYQVRLNFMVDKNGSYNFGNTTIEGRTNVKEDIIREQIVYKEGKPFNILDLEDTYDRLYELGIYDYILVKPDLKSNKKNIPMHIKLKKGETKFLKSSVGYNTDTGLRGSFSWIDKNFLSNLKVFDLGLLASQEGYEVYNLFYNPYIIVPFLEKITLENRVSFSDYDYESYKEKLFENRLTFGKRVHNERSFKLDHYFGLLTERSFIKSKIDDSENESGNYFINSLFYRLLLDKRDSQVDAKHGYYVNLYIENSLIALGSDFNYFKSILELRYIKTYHEKLTFGIKTRVGRISNDVPIFKRFYSGGSFTNRGYNYQELGNKDSKGVALGGVSLLDILSEVRYELFDKFSLVGFYDTSTLSLDTDSYTEKFYPTIGTGIRYLTPIGPLRLDFGFPLEDRGEWVFHISIGQVF